MQIKLAEEEKAQLLFWTSTTPTQRLVWLEEVQRKIMNKHCKFALIIIVLLFQTACSLYVPLTRNEFIDAVKQGKGPMKVENQTVNVDIKLLVSHLRKKSNECLDKVINRSSAAVGYVEVSKTYYNTKLEHATKTKAEFTLQVKHVPRGVGAKHPEDGLYTMAIDLISQGSNKTILHIYKPTFAYDDIGDTIQEWAMGKETSCPKLH